MITVEAVRRNAIAILAVLALVGGAYLVLVDDESEGPLDLRAIAQCERPRVREAPSHETEDIRLDARLEPVGDLDVPTAADRWTDGRIVVAEREGRIVLLDPADGSMELLLDLTDRVSVRLEGGLLGLAVDPDERFLYTHHTDADGTSHILAWPIRAGAVDPGGEVSLFEVPHPGNIHIGGHLAFGPDGFLYLGFGDGGLSIEQVLDADRDDVLDSKLLRVDPTPDGPEPYAIPADNPFVDTEGVRPEIWLHGARNPWRFSFDAETGDLWLGDVGNNCWEEVNLVPARTAGLDLGWPRFEGEHGLRDDQDDGRSTFPLHTIRHDERTCAVIGGYVYRGTAIPDLVGRYVFADLCGAELQWLEQTDDGTRGGGLGVEQTFVIGFWADEDGELWVMTTEAGLLRLVPD